MESEIIITYNEEDFHFPDSTYDGDAFMAVLIEQELNKMGKLEMKLRSWGNGHVSIRVHGKGIKDIK
ncbi:MAG: hypothetical protein DRI97_03915 [Bacteroidetes bacterium]|nr:MAG: hypothetical protein DRI97_03915 [Bacteroidota bacterium]